MSTNELREDLLSSLTDVYHMKAFGTLEDMLQGENVILQYLLAHHGEAVYPSDLSRDLRLSRSRITGALTSLRNKGFVEMVHSEKDRRRVQVFITREGTEAIMGKFQLMNCYFDQMIAGLGQEDTASLIRIIRRCVEVMNT